MIQTNTDSIPHAHKNHFFIPFLLIFAFAVVEVIGGFWTGSLALLGDAGHMVSDVASLGLAWFAANHSQKANARKHASGMSHMEIFASICNAILMLVVVAWIVYEAIQRFKNPPHVAGAEVVVIAFVGLIVNVVVAKIMHHDADSHSKDNLNHRAAFLHVLGDLLGSVAALVAGAVIYFTGYMTIDPILSIFISGLILLGTLSLIKDIWHTLHRGDASHRHEGHQH
ncbi:MAG: cation diffusion facilitator family transporter [Methylophilaceae bacterium]